MKTYKDVRQAFTDLHNYHTTLEHLWCLLNSLDMVLVNKDKVYFNLPISRPIKSLPAYFIEIL